MWSSWLPDTGFRSAVTEPKDDMTPRRAAANSRRRTGCAPLDPDSRFARQRTTAIRAGVEIMGRRHREQSAPQHAGCADPALATRCATLDAVTTEYVHVRNCPQHAPGTLGALVALDMGRVYLMCDEEEHGYWD